MGRLRQAIRNLSIRKTFMLYMLFFLVLAALLSKFAMAYASQEQFNLYVEYMYPNAQYGDQVNVDSDEVNIHFVDYSVEDDRIINNYDAVYTWSTPFFYGACILLSSLLFYRNKLKQPIAILSEASRKIADNDLDFRIQHTSTDEMGQLCRSFETMRAALDENNRKMWRGLEERKQLNAAFSHDLRTPLTVLRGYADFLNNYLPQGKVSTEKVISTVSTMSAHIVRLEGYVQMMSEAQRLEDTGLAVAQVNSDVLTARLKSTAEVLERGQAYSIGITSEIDQAELVLDMNIVMRVFENLLSNASRYAERMISINCTFVNGMLVITVQDDGKGFSDEQLMQLPRPSGKQHTTGGEFHMGLGLHICTLLGEKHGGCIELANAEDGGASVTARFRCQADAGAIPAEVDKK
ncbi:HAMP domain-containing sensor histidine kinase [Paenibacillus donghaensis]|uniref:histidine kinase n=1 Tax=Paenibacillus donghaensis TaxID=414771 RepID=A0A2Z2KL63_9BACL|nr:HAMP domain-containing sensor histidine kinase [Paenibacillus donghaensis]ASA24093.1 hypothetical protein B9T62_26905 [Paenibacillus donghaensis]